MSSSLKVGAARKERRTNLDKTLRVKGDHPRCEGALLLRPLFHRRGPGARALTESISVVRVVRMGGKDSQNDRMCRFERLAIRRVV